MKENKSFRRKKQRFVTALDLIKCLKQIKLHKLILTRPPISYVSCLHKLKLIVERDHGAVQMQYEFPSSRLYEFPSSPPYYIPLHSPP